ncbi:hypothetical protein COY26_04305 [Candidatus Woesearchaeota archaeon CG_4_10_14_0_2_um_filter_33_10]|nr:MAG: hypothetical protein AUJ83_00290 [Candidatus Woesearchaeota archaeon CG1_02_33_12]PIZ52566.1 MAG: hypothetical protein COY26_04305 [Candidatus Woesearchaeota archaeon CG_4_10_14_0_2_um_filter_33_10]
MKRRIWSLIFLVFLLVITPLNVKSFPEISVEFYGTATINWTNASAGSNVSAYDSDSVLCGYFIVSNEGYYGLLSCDGDNNETLIDDGAEPNDNITFYVDNERAVLFGNTSWQSGTFKYVNVSAQNYPPYFEHNLTHQYVNETFTLLYDINCSDLNYWDNLTYYDNTSFFNISLTTGIINWTPLNEHVGNQSIEIICSDGQANTSGILNITVYDVENAPVLIPIGNQIAVEGELFIYDVNATDPDDDNLTYSANTTIFIIDPNTGLINFTPTLANVGNHTINISVSDGLLVDWEVIHFRIVRGPYCGDGVCDIDENCYTCPEDCGLCPSVPTVPGTGGGETGAGGEGEVSRRIYPGVCNERWECADWSECYPEGYQTRKCIDLNKCGTTKKKPEERIECVYIGTCTDGIQNCHDGLCEESIDCGGPCSPCPVPPSCFDGIQNCHDGSCEEEIDCGGPCEPCEIKKYAKIPFLEKPLCMAGYPWILLILVSIIMVLTTAGDRIYIKKITKKELKEYRKKMVSYRKVRHRIYALSIAICSIILIISFFIYLNQCKEASWLFYFLIPVIVVLSVIILTYLNKRLRYNEFKKKKEEKRLTKTDKMEKESLIKIEETTLLKLELDIGKKVYDSINLLEFNEDIIDLLKDVYRSIRSLTKRRREMLKPFETSQKTKESINNLSSDEILINISKKYFEFGEILNNIKNLSRGLAKKRIKEEKINKLVKEFIFNVTEISADKHIMMIIKSDKKLAEIYNEFVDVYRYYKEQIDKKHNAQEEIIRIESNFKKEIENTSNNSDIMKKIEDNDKLTSFYNRLVDLYNSYKKKEELYNEMKQLERNKQETI